MKMDDLKNNWHILRERPKHIRFLWMRNAASVADRDCTVKSRMMMTKLLTLLWYRDYLYIVWYWLCMFDMYDLYDIIRYWLLLLFVFDLCSHPVCWLWSSLLQAACLPALRVGTCESYFFVRIESRIESAIRFVFESNLRIESAVSRKP